IEEVAKPVAEVEEEQVIAPTVDLEEGQMDVLMIDMEEDLVALFDDDDFENDASDRFGEAEVWEVSDAKVAASVTIRELDPRVYAVKGQVQVMVSQMAHADRWEQVGAQVEQGQQTAAQRDETVAELTQQVQTFADRCATERHADPAATDYSYRDEQQGEHIDAVHSGIGERIAALERRPPGPQ
ncbi:hypothetical protein Tco_0958814, partial [Tanacetum coccineum]